MPGENCFDCRSSSTSHCYLSLITLSALYMLFWVNDLRRRKTKVFELSFFCALCKNKGPKLQYLQIRNYECPIIETKTKLLFLVGSVEFEKLKMALLSYALLHGCGANLMHGATCSFSYLYYHLIYKMLKLLPYYMGILQVDTVSFTSGVRKYFEWANINKIKLLYI